jgi:predicted ATP-grasp superfamily ATP-dependent carboligase
MALHRRIESRLPVSPVLVVHLEGWIDAGLGGGAAMASLFEGTSPEPVAVFDGDELIDYRARRPTLRISDGVNAGLTWHQPRMFLNTDRADNDILLLVGPEPDMRWHAFVDDVVELSRELGVRLCVGLGAFPAPVPHTRPVRIASTATEEELAARTGFVTGTIEVPSSITGALERGFRKAGIPAIGLWARVPHYVAAMPYPAASSALIATLCSIGGLTLDTATLDTAADVTQRRVEELIANSEEHTQMVAQLEATVDTSEGNPLNLGQIPSGDEIAAELERFLQGENGNG